MFIYKVEMFMITDGDAKRFLQSVLDKYAEEGWRLSSMASTGNYNLILVFEKAK